MIMCITTLYNHWLFFFFCFLKSMTSAAPPTAAPAAAAVAVAQASFGRSDIVRRDNIRRPIHLNSIEKKQQFVEMPFLLYSFFFSLTKKKPRSTIIYICDAAYTWPLLPLFNSLIFQFNYWLFTTLFCLFGGQQTNKPNKLYLSFIADCGAERNEKCSVLGGKKTSRKAATTTAQRRLRPSARAVDDAHGGVSTSHYFRGRYIILENWRGETTDVQCRVVWSSVPRSLIPLFRKQQN